MLWEKVGLILLGTQRANLGWGTWRRTTSKGGSEHEAVGACLSGIQAAREKSLGSNYVWRAEPPYYPGVTPDQKDSSCFKPSTKESSRGLPGFLGS